MKKKRMIAAAALGTLLIVTAGLLWPRGGQGVFYRIQGGKSEMVVLGSIHAGSREMYPMSRSIRHALKDADTLVFECDTESEEALATTQQLMYYPQEESLSEHVSESCLAALSETAQKLGYDPQALNRLKPWALVSMLSVESMSQQTGGSSELGVENQVRRMAKGKTVRYLETAEEQLLLMDGFSAELQEYLLMDACEAALHHGRTNDDAQHWPAWWAKGDADAFAASYRKGMEDETQPQLAQEYHEKLITGRNQRMARTLGQMLEEEGGSFFVTVGLMHLVLEEDSILTRLENMGYTIERIME